jgi:hypothetical protein
MKKIALTILVASLLSGCAGFIKATSCTEGYREVLVQENARLVAQEKMIDEFEARGGIPGYNYAGTGLTADRVLYGMKASHNASVETLERNVKYFNSTCVGA